MLCYVTNWPLFWPLSLKTQTYANLHQHCSDLQLVDLYFMNLWTEFHELYFLSSRLDFRKINEKLVSRYIGKSQLSDLFTPTWMHTCHFWLKMQLFDCKYPWSTAQPKWNQLINWTTCSPDFKRFRHSSKKKTGLFFHIPGKVTVRAVLTDYLTVHRRSWFEFWSQNTLHTAPEEHCSKEPGQKATVSWAFSATKPKKGWWNCCCGNFKCLS